MAFRLTSFRTWLYRSILPVLRLFRFPNIGQEMIDLVFNHSSLGRALMGIVAKVNEVGSFRRLPIPHGHFNERP